VPPLTWSTATTTTYTVSNLTGWPTSRWNGGSITTSYTSGFNTSYTSNTMWWAATVRPRSHVAAVVTPEERQAQAYERLRLQAEAEAAVLRAEELLQRCLTPIQRETLRTCGWFDVRGGVSKAHYRIHRGRGINIECLVDGLVSHKLCFHPGVECPDADSMLSQKLMLEHSEIEALQVANRHRPTTRALVGQADYRVGPARCAEIYQGHA